MVDKDEDVNDNEEQTLAKYLVSLSAKDRELISDLSIDIGELLLFQIDDFDDLINKPRPDLDQQQQSRRIEIIRQISNLQACDRVQEECGRHPDNYNFIDASGNDNNNNEIIKLQLSPVLKQSGIVTSFVLYTSKKTIELLLNHKYEGKTVIFPVDIDKASFNWTKFIDSVETKLKNKGLGQEHVTMLVDSLDENWKKISDSLHKDNEDSDESSDEVKSVAQIALSLAEEHCSELFLDQYGTPYAALKIGEHVETVRLKDSRFKNWLYRTFYLSEDKILNSESVTNVLNILIAKAEFEGATRTLDLRVTSVQDEPFTIYYDLCNKDWQVVKITPEGWSIEPNYM